MLGTTNIARASGASHAGILSLMSIATESHVEVLTAVDHAGRRFVFKLPVSVEVVQLAAGWSVLHAATGLQGRGATRAAALAEFAEAVDLAWLNGQTQALPGLALRASRPGPLPSDLVAAVELLPPGRVETLTQVVSGGRRFVFSAAIDVEVTHPGSTWVFWHYPTGMNSYGLTYAEAATNFADDVAHCWDIYALSSDAELAPRARHLKQQLLELIAEVLPA